MLRFLLLTLFWTGVIKCQEPDCPKGWEEYAGSCYKFFRTPLRQRDDALGLCSSYNAHLLSVDTMEEHAFITGWLRQNDPQHRLWYTSGVDRSPQNDGIVWNWDGDNTGFLSMDQAWLPNEDQVHERFVAYFYSELAKRWGFKRVSGSVYSPYICEVPKNMLSLLIVMDRGPDFGLFITERELIPRAPFFSEEPKDAIFDQSGRLELNDIALRCSAEGYPFPTYEWFKEEYENDRVRFRRIDPLADKRMTQTDGALTIHDPDAIQDRGKYHCTAANKFGTAVGKSVQLSFGMVAQFNIKRSDERGKENWGKAIYCDPPQHYPDVFYSWARGKFPNFVDEDKRTFVSQDGYLYFSVLESIDQGKYTCSVKSKASSVGRTGPTFNLFVDSNPSPMQLQFPNNFPKVFPEAPIAGDHVRIECFAFGYPVPAYNWTRKGFSSELPFNSSLLNYNRVLLIPSVSVEDQGEYVCVGSNGRSSISNSVTLTVQSRPVFTIPLEDQYMDKGADLSWNCEAFGIPAVQYSWLKNGQELGQYNTRQEDTERIIIRGETLVIRNLDPRNDPGVYQCRATNQLGTTYSTGELRVLTMAPSFAKFPLQPEIVAVENGNITIRCQPEAAPMPQFIWLKNDRRISPDQRIRIMKNGFLVIQPVRREDTGAYTCAAENEFGKDQSRGFLTVLVEPQFIDRPRPTYFTRENDTVELYCEVTGEGALDLAYVWYKNGIRIKPYVSLGTQKWHEMSPAEGRDWHYSEGWRPGTLVIRNITSLQKGEYECIAKTPISKVMSRSEVVVSGPPGQPGGLSIVATSGTAIRLIWTDGPSNGRPILVYDIEGRTRTNDTWVTIMRDISLPTFMRERPRKEILIEEALLSPWSQYEFRLTAKNDLGAGPPSSASPSHLTREDKPWKYPDHIGGGGGKVGDLTVTWTPLPPKDQNAKGIYYRVFYKLADSNVEYRVEELRNRGNIGMHVMRVGEKSFFLPYKVKVQAVNSIGAGPESPEMIVYSAENMPNAAPVQVGARSFNSTALRVTWLPVAETREAIRGILIGHRLKYWKQGDNITDATYYLSRSKYPEAMVVGLQPNTYYSVVVMAYNEAGPGPESEPYIERTFKSAPLKPPTSVLVEATSATSVKVTWRSVAPSQEEEPYIGFRVRYWEADQDFSTFHDVAIPLGSTLEAHVTGLKPGVQYKLRVLAYSQGGDGRMSSPAWEFQMGDAKMLMGSAAVTSSLSMWILGSASLLLLHFYAFRLEG